MFFSEGVFCSEISSQVLISPQRNLANTKLPLKTDSEVTPT